MAQVSLPVGPPGVLRGTLLECDVDARGGQFSVRSAQNQVFRFAFDAKTYFERENQRVAAGALIKGDAVEIVSDHAPAVSLRYARTVHVLDPRPPVRTAARRRWPLYAAETLVPRGDLTFAGIVERVDAERLVLRTRENVSKSILLRDDTKYLDSGSAVDFSTLTPNTRVFVRGGKSIYDEVEAYQVVWGRILEPVKP